MREGLREELEKRFGADATVQTAAWAGFAAALDGVKAHTALEIGTMHGLTAGILAEFADRVVTIDVVDRPIADVILDAMGVRNRVARIVVKDDSEKALVIALLKFDLAFIDADHSRLAVAQDFSLVRKCGRVLFHDYPAVEWGERPYDPTAHMNGNGPADGPGFLLDALRPAGRIVRKPPFAWWFAQEQSGE